jgi:DNA polymerase III delta subunit
MRNAKSSFVEKTEKLYPNSTSEFFDGTGEISFGEFIQKIATPSMFGDTKILFLNHAESKNVLAPKQHYEAFEKIMSLCVEEVFVFVELNSDESDKTPKDCLSIGELMENLRGLTKKHSGSFSEFWAMKEYDIPEWIVQKVREYYDRQISKANAELLVKLSGADLGVLDGELRKMDAALPSKKEIGENDIYELTGNNRQVSMQEITHFIGLRKWNNEAAETFDNLTGKDNQFVIPFLSELYRKFWILLKIRLFADENREKANTYFKVYDYKAKNQAAFEIAVACGILKESQKTAVFPIVIKPKLLEQASSYSKNDIFQIIKMIAQYDRDIKNGEIKSDLHKESIKEMCRQIVRIGK